MRTGPDYIQLYPTLRCNQACGFCFNRSMPFVPDMTLSAFFRLLDAAGGAGVRTIDIMGGEPTLHPDLTLFVREAVRRGFCVNLSSNGSNLDVLGHIMDLGDAVTVGISINDQKTLTRVSSFVGQHRPVVKTVYSRTMDRELAGKILALAPRKFYLIYRDSLDPGELSDTVPFDQFKSDVDQAYPQAGQVFCSGFLPDRKACPELASVRCPAGTTKIGVMPDGSVYPCNLFFGKRDFLLGNILADPFEKFWSHSVLAFFRAKPQNTCTRTACRLHAACHGGCPAHGCFLQGRLGAPDPRCLVSENITVLI